MTLYPPDDPFLFNIVVFGIPIAVRWYGVLIMSGALIATWIAGARATARGIAYDHVWNQLLIGLLLGIAGARIYYVSFEWERFAANPWSVLNLTTGGLAIHGGIIGALLAVVIYASYARLPFWQWLDICVPGFLLGQAIGRWGNFFNQEAYGRPTTLGFGVRIDPEHRVPPYTSMQTYPANTLFHPTFLYESAWNLGGVGLLLLLERLLGQRGRGWLRHGDLLFGYAIYYSLGRLWIEGLRTDSLCLNGFGGDCAGSLRVAQVVSLLLLSSGVVGLVINHLVRRRRDNVEQPPRPRPGSDTMASDVTRRSKAI